MCLFILPLSLCQTKHLYLGKGKGRGREEGRRRERTKESGKGKGGGEGNKIIGKGKKRIGEENEIALPEFHCKK